MFDATRNYGYVPHNEGDLDQAHDDSFYHAHDDSFYVVSESLSKERAAPQYEQRGRQVHKDAKSSNKITKDSLSGSAKPPGLVSPNPSSMPMPFQKSKKVPPAPALTGLLPRHPPVQKGYDVEVKGLPQRLMSRAMMEAMLEQAVLDKHVVGFAFEGSSGARITLSTLSAAELCKTHFHGCKWDSKGMGIQAYLVHQDSHSHRQAAIGHKVNSHMKAPHARAPGCWTYTDAKAPVAGVGNSDASTTVSDEDPEQDIWGNVWTGAPVW